MKIFRAKETFRIDGEHALLLEGQVFMLCSDLRLPHPSEPRLKDGYYNLNEYWEQLNPKTWEAYATLQGQNGIRHRRD
jgi:hypothetical protein